MTSAKRRSSLRLKPLSRPRPGNSEWLLVRKSAPRSRVSRVLKRSPARWKWWRRAKCAALRTAWSWVSPTRSACAPCGPYCQLDARIPPRLYAGARSQARGLHHCLDGSRAVWWSEHQPVQGGDSVDESAAGQGVEVELVLGGCQVGRFFCQLWAATLRRLLETSAKNLRWKT